MYKKRNNISLTRYSWWGWHDSRTEMRAAAKKAGPMYFLSHSLIQKNGKMNLKGSSHSWMLSLGYHISSGNLFKTFNFQARERKYIYINMYKVNPVCVSTLWWFWSFNEPLSRSHHLRMKEKPALFFRDFSSLVSSITLSLNFLIVWNVCLLYSLFMSSSQLVSRCVV